MHQRVDFGFHAAFEALLPVFGRERIKRQIADAQIRRNLGDAPNGVDALGMPHRTVEPAALRPTSVTVHYHGNMLRQPTAVYLTDDIL